MDCRNMCMMCKHAICQGQGPACMATCMAGAEVTTTTTPPATCATHTCAAGYAPISDATTVGDTDAICCEATCAAHTCTTPGWASKSTMATTVGNTDAVCCEDTTCAAHTCTTPGWVSNS